MLFFKKKNKIEPINPLAVHPENNLNYQSDYDQEYNSNSLSSSELSSEQKYNFFSFKVVDFKLTILEKFISFLIQLFLILFFIIFYTAIFNNAGASLNNFLVILMFVFSALIGIYFFFKKQEVDEDNRLNYATIIFLRGGILTILISFVMNQHFTDSVSAAIASFQPNINWISQNGDLLFLLATPFIQFFITAVLIKNFIFVGLKSIQNNYFYSKYTIKLLIFTTLVLIFWPYLSKILSNPADAMNNLIDWIFSLINK
ncbi:MAG: hypothetical protein LBC17_01455 [Lactobacillaceae bacterium]|jgi:hypothetical protein|nr:hypothetical protein [Lactobacillaceae bacterium]